MIAAVARLAAYREAVDGAEKRCVHAVASPPTDRRYSQRALWGTRSDAFETAGIRGGAMVTHPYRTNERDNALYESAVDTEAVSENTGKWRFLRESADDWADMTRYVEASPHYHALAFGTDIRGEEAPEGWVVERIRTMQPFHRHDPEAYRDMARSVYYVLTHGAVQDGRQLVTYFGAVHPATFRPEEELTATVWDRIQREAEQAVKGPTEESEEAARSAGPDECPREECEAVVRDIVYLQEYLNDEEWASKIQRKRGGWQRWLRGAFIWWDGRTDRPPPSAVRSRKRFRVWLEERGDVLTPGPSYRQVQLTSAVME